MERDSATPTGSADAALIAESLTRPQAFAAIFDRHFDAVHGYLARRVGVDVADDLAAATFTIAFERRATFHDQPSARPWLFGIATNLLRNQWRSERRALQALAALAGVVRDAGETGDTTASLGEALARLDAGQRDALLLHAWEGFSYEEIARALGVPVGTVRSRLARARTRLRAELGASRTAAARPVPTIPLDRDEVTE